MRELHFPPFRTKDEYENKFDKHMDKIASSQLTRSEKLALYRHGISRLRNLRKSEDSAARAAPPARSERKEGLASPDAKKRRSTIATPVRVFPASPELRTSSPRTFPWAYKRVRKPNPRVIGAEWEN